MAHRFLSAEQSRNKGRSAGKGRHGVQTLRRARDAGACLAVCFTAQNGVPRQRAQFCAGWGVHTVDTLWCRAGRQDYGKIQKAEGDFHAVTGRRPAVTALAKRKIPAGGVRFFSCLLRQRGQDGRQTGAKKENSVTAQGNFSHSKGAGWRAEN